MPPDLGPVMVCAGCPYIIHVQRASESCLDAFHPGDPHALVCRVCSIPTRGPTTPPSPTLPYYGLAG